MGEWANRLAPELRALVELDAQDGYVTGAAQTLAVPQSTLSRRIHGLEEMLGVPLLVREGRRSVLTPRARDLAEAVRGPLRALEGAVAAVAEEADPAAGRVRFGFPLTMGEGRVPDLLAEFRRAHPGIRLELRQAHGAGLFTDLRTGRLDIAVTIPAPADEGSPPGSGATRALPHRILAQQRIVAVLPRGHTLAGRASLALGELAPEHFIATPWHFHLRRLTEDWCRAEGFSPRVEVEAAEFAAVRQLIARGLGVALLPRSEASAPDTVEVPLAAGRQRSSGEPALPGSDPHASAATAHSREIALAWTSAPLTAPAALLRDFIVASF